MTVSKSTVAPVAGSSLQTTRQMLDELDALMERMLALPVNELEDAPAPRPASKTPTVVASLTLLGSAPDAAAVAVAAADEPPASVAAPEPLPPLPPAPMPALPEPMVERVEPPTQLPQVGALLAEVPQPVPTTESVLAWPLLWLNESFDRAVEPFGFAGRWARGSSGRMILGLTGLALLIASTIWFLKDWLGWPC